MALLDLFKKKKPARAGAAGANAPQAVTSKELLEQIANRNYPGLAIYVRDVNLPPQLAEKYTPGLIIREKAFTDASDRVMGMVTTHRYLILSNHMANLSAMEKGKNWGLHVAKTDSHFKVLGTHVYKGKTAIVLLHLPYDETWRVYKNYSFSMDETVYKMAIDRFEKKCEMPPIAELSTPEWLERCAFPLGMSDDGTLWALE